MESDIIATQLQGTLQSCISRALFSRRPLLTHLNADTTWLISLPKPTGLVPGEKIYYHILIDPWLRGGQSDVAKFFSQQWHATESIVQSIHEVEEVVQRIEWDAISSTSEWNEKIEQFTFDAVVVSHEFTDHMHKETLTEVDPRIPVFATKRAAGSIKSWRYFENVFDIQNFTGRTEITASWGKVLPPWLSIHRLVSDGNDLLYYHTAILIVFENESLGREAIIYTPHGISPADIGHLVSSTPPIQTLVLLHGLHDIAIGSQLNLGAHNGLKVQRMTGARYWVGTHDEIKKGGGLVSWFLRRKVLTIKEAIEMAGMETSQHVRFAELRNGESLVLE
jgi:hypothetical protein